MIVPRTAAERTRLPQHHSRIPAAPQAVDALPEIYRDVVRLRYFEELPTDEVAEALGCAEGTVKSRLARGLAMLQQNLEATE